MANCCFIPLLQDPVESVISADAILAISGCETAGDGVGPPWDKLSFTPPFLSLLEQGEPEADFIFNESF